jgi:hypothetical protein
MKLTDYKFWFIRRDDDGFITEAAIRFYEGETIKSGKENVYIRNKRLEAKDLKHLSSLTYKKEIGGKDTVIYTPYNFGKIKTDNKLREFLNKELAKDKGRQPIKQQICQL